MTQKNFRLEAIKRKPTDTLAFGRTVMANERTFLSFLRTRIGLLGGGLGIIGLVNHPMIVVLGWIAIIFSVPVLIWGMWRFQNIRGLLNDTKKAVFVVDEKEAVDTR